MRTYLTCLLALLCGVTSQAGPGRSQQRAEPLAFDVVSVRQNDGGDGLDGGLRHLPGRLVVRNTLLRVLVAFAYGIPFSAESYLLVGGRDEVLMARFDIEATLPSGVRSVAAAERRSMVRRLLIERFLLETHTETRPVPIYALTVAEVGRLGPSLRPSEHDCDKWQAARMAGVEFLDFSSPPSRAGEPTDANGRSWCGGETTQFLQGGGLRLRYAGELGALIRSIQGSVDRLIVDETGLTGSFEWTVTYASPFLERFFAEGSGLPGVFTALREQLGLELKPRDAPVEVRVVDSVSMPERN